MKKICVLMLGTAIVFGGQSALCQAVKPPAAPVAEAPKPMPMHGMVESIDASAKTFTHKNKDGTLVTHRVTDKTEIKNAGKDAKFEDIKVGDSVSGLCLKKSATEYEVVKITKFGPEMTKPMKPMKPMKAMK